MPSTAELQAMIPTGRLAVAIKSFIPPQPSFGPGSVEYLQRQADRLALEEQQSTVDDASSQTQLDNSDKSYVGAGAYF